MEEVKKKPKLKRRGEIIKVLDSLAKEYEDYEYIDELIEKLKEVINKIL